ELHPDVRSRLAVDRCGRDPARIKVVRLAQEGCEANSLRRGVIREGDAVPLFPRAKPAGTFSPCSLSLGLASLGGQEWDPAPSWADRGRRWSRRRSADAVEAYGEEAVEAAAVGRRA